MDIVLPLSQPHTQSLITIADALIQNGWQPPKVSFPYYQQSNGVGLKALSSSSLTILQEDLAALHASHPTQDPLEAIGNVDHPAALRDGLVGFQHGLIIRNLQHGYADILHTVDIRNSPREAARYVDEGSAQWLRTPGTGTYDQCYSNQIYRSHTPSGQASPITEWSEGSRASSAQTLGQAISPDTWHLGRKRKSSSSIDDAATLFEYQPLSSLDYTDFRSDTRITRLPTRRAKKPVAADFFTPQPSLEPEKREGTPLKFSMDDIENLIKEERAAAEKKDLWTIPEHEYNAARGVPIKGTAGKSDAPARGFGDSDGRNFKKSRSTDEPPPVSVQLDGRFLRKQFSPGRTDGKPEYVEDLRLLGTEIKKGRILLFTSVVDWWW
ncbi:MAG: hypothetical protein LQ350_004771 [Teloschistes chrysophthalmus]|nr:MAG: hypothetical protein LQ350_004771 [Niorma chrysophthalma]